MPRKRDTAYESIQKFRDRIDTSGDCHIWTGRKVGNGYGSVYCYGMNWRAHRLAWTLKHGPIDDGVVIAHRCDNPACVNISHLFACTQQENIADRDRKRRTATGSGAGGAVLVEGDVDRIRDMLRCGVAQHRIADWFGVERTTINKISTGKNWGQYVSEPLREAPR